MIKFEFLDYRSLLKYKDFQKVNFLDYTSLKKFITFLKHFDMDLKIFNLPKEYWLTLKNLSFSSTWVIFSKESIKKRNLDGPLEFEKKLEFETKNLFSPKNYLSVALSRNKQNKSLLKVKDKSFNCWDQYLYG